MKTLLATSLLLLAATAASAQLDTVSYPQERQAIRAMLHGPGGPERVSCPNDIVAVGAKGDISYSVQQWKGVQTKEKLVFKSVKPVPGTEIIRIYGGTSAVVNWLADVQLNVNGRDVALKVRRLEVFIKKDTGWCRVAGQGTEVDEKMHPISH
ncbi:hypothetical protein J0X19_02755 [Hymenobacter sp. BT186]|uniref:Nuclear transport factor 2 family protein n=1 Tax=Hymenobacter telluris TaxID=2816474 RepID=A0A939ETH5_9BACT|nr:hypothetical protein [Hymenobacter telluris]MBO0356854.1 hypothetical protein [Hymenobacter telluris]MBW3372880.1 hypothetical protein [Hymenobacter norwichensis]